MEVNKELQTHIFDIIENQLKENNPPETKKTLERLQNEGYNAFQAKQLIGQCVTVELFGVLKNGEEFDNERYTKNLEKLPKEPFD